MAKPKTKMKLCRRLDSGVLKIKDRKLDADGKEEIVFHVLNASYSPVRAMVEKTRKKPKPGSKTGETIDEPIKGDFKPKKDAKGKPVWAKPGKVFEVFDAEFVLKSHGGILEKV